MLLAEIPYPRIDPDIFHLGPFHLGPFDFAPTVRWYGVSYVLAFILSYVVLRALSRRGKWPVPPERVADVLFWGILGVFFGGRIGWVLFYGLPSGSIQDFWQVFKVWEGGMSFHGGLLGVIVAYWIYVHQHKLRRGQFFDGLAVATPLGILSVRLANFVNAELYGRPWDGPWAMRFPRYQDFNGPQNWNKLHDAGGYQGLFTELRHPSQLYEAMGEGIFLFLLLWWLMVKKGVGGGRIAATFLVGYGFIRFLIEYVREPDTDMGYVLFGTLTQGQLLSMGMILAGLITFAVIAIQGRTPSSGSA